MKSATIKVRCISDKALEAILEMLAEESNAVTVESWNTNEGPNSASRGRLNHYSADGYSAVRGRPRGRSQPAPARNRANAA